MKKTHESATRFALIFAFVVTSFSAFAQPVSLTGPSTFTSNDAFLQYVEQQTFNYFWTEANTNNGLICIRSDEPTTCSITAVGFGLSAICVGINEGWITRDQGRARVLAALQTLYNAPQGSGASGYAGYHGWFYHHLDMNTGLRTDTSELSSSDTAALMSGVIDAGIYFSNPTNTDEAQIRTLSSNLFNDVDFQFMLNSNNNTVYLQWTPETGFTNVGGYIGYNQVAYLYLYGLGATNNPLPAASWNAWVNGFRWETNYGYSYAFIPQLFCYQYSHCWIDFQGIPDAYMLAKGSDYFQNSREATLAQQAYAIANPNHYPNYGSNEWGFTSCSTPSGYVTCGAPNGTDNGTIAPTAAAGSMPFAPEICLPAILNMYNTYTDNLWTTEGFRDSYNIASNDWFCPDTLAIDEGPIVLMIENYRTGSIWNRMMSSPIVQRGLQRAGFTAPPPNVVSSTLIASNQISVSWSGISTYQTGYEILTSSNGVNFSLSAITTSNANSAIISWPANTICYIQVVTTSPAGVSGSIVTDVLAGFPTLNAIANLTFAENAGQQTITLSGISSGTGNPNQILTISAASSNINLVPNPTINYTSPNATGSLTFTSANSSSGSAIITVTVNNGSNTVTQTFTVTILPQTTLPLYEPFNYPAGTQLQGQGGWVTNSIVSEVGLVAPGNLTIPFAPPPIGNHYNWSNSVTDRLPFGIQTNGTIYFSFAYRIETIGSSIGENTFAGLALSNSTTLYPKIDAFLAGPDAYQIGIAKGSGLNGNAGTNAIVFTTNDTVFIVACLNMFPNPTNGDTVDLWVNPDPATYGEATAPLPSVANIDGAPDPSGGIDRISLRGGSASSSPQSQDVDELRIGYTWASVTPPAPVSLASSLNGNSVVVSWPTNNIGWNLTFATNMLTGPWTTIAPIVTEGTNNTYTESIAGQQFFRLTR